MESTTFLTRRRNVVLLAILCCMLWGSATPFIKMGYRLFAIDGGDTASLILFAGVRFTISGVLVVAMGSVPRRRLLTPKTSSWGMIFRLCLFQTVMQYVCYYVGLAHSTAVKAAIFNSTGTFFCILVASLIFRQEPLRPRKVAGCAIGFVGVLIGTIGNHGSGSGWGVFCMMAATVIFTLSGPWNKSVTKKADSFAVCFLNLFVGGLALFVLGTVMGGRLHIQSALAVLVMLYLAFICGAGYILWALLMKNNPVSRIAIFGFVNPVVNVLLSAVLNGEPLFRWQYLAALLFVCVGIWLVNKAPAQKEKL